MASFLQFRESLLPLGVFTIHQAELMSPGIDRTMITRWVSRGYIIRLRRGLYVFPEILQQPNINLYLSSVIYSPSYVSLHQALAFYGIIPESVIDITAVSTLKTASFKNKAGNYFYYSIAKSLFWGYEFRNLPDGRSFAMATPEKALFDLFHFFPFYKTEEDMLDLRLDQNFMEDELNIDRLRSYLEKAGNKTINNKFNTLATAYNIEKIW